MNKKIVVNFISPDEKTRRSCQTDDWRNAEWSPTQLKVSISPTIFSVQTVQKLPPFWILELTFKQQNGRFLEQLS